MNGIKRYKLVATESARNVIEASDGHWVHYSNVEQLKARIKELESDAHINEIKAQGIGDAIKGFRTFAISNNVNLACEDFDEYLCEQVNKLRAKDEKEI